MKWEIVTDTTYAPVTRDSDAIRRWVNLIAWWEGKVGRKLGSQIGFQPFDSYPDDGYIDVKTGELKTYHDSDNEWIELEEYEYDPELRGLIDYILNYSLNDVPSEIDPQQRLSLPPEHKNWWRFEEIGQNEIMNRRKLHDDLVNAARAVLEMRMPLDDYNYNPKPGSRPRGILDIWPPDSACWDAIVPGEAVNAAILLANLGNPYPAPAIGPGPIKQGATAARRATVKKLGELTRKTDKRTLTIQELTVLCLLAKPYLFVNEVNGIPAYLAGKDEWTPAPNPKSVKPESLFKSAGFMNLKRTISDDLKGGRKSCPKSKSGN